VSRLLEFAGLDGFVELCAPTTLTDPPELAPEPVPVPVPWGYRVVGAELALRHPFGGESEFYRHGWNSWSPTGWTRLDGPTLGIRDSPGRLLTADDASLETVDSHSGSAVGAVTGTDGNVLLLGALGLGSPRVGADATTLWGRAGDSDAQWYLAYGPELEVFAEYTRMLIERLGRRSGPPGRVWCSWYSYFEDIDEELIDRTVTDLAGYPFDVVQLDDGWETLVGDWTANARFPSGMRRTAERIADAGFRPGLWLAPLIALPGSEITRTRPDLLVHDENGAPAVAGHNWGSHYFALDTTSPEVVDHLREVFERVTGWGFSYLKLDFMYAGAILGVRGTDLPREAVYRQAIEHIRSAVGDDVYLLGCGVPMIPSVGVFDGVRVGPDVAAYWDNEERSNDPSGSGARNSLVNSLNRAWMRGLYDVDPDVVSFRSRRTLLGPLELGALQDVAEALQFRSTSDPISWLDEAERAQLVAYLSTDHHVEQLGRYRYRLGERVVDFTGVIDGSSGLGRGASIG
jgi:alpha-galactosidase